MQTRDQKFAAKIFEQMSNLPAADHQKYGTMAHKLPILIRTAGLVQALTFVEARGSEAQHKLLDHLAATADFADRATLLKESREAQLDRYMQLSEEIMAALLWYKRFAQSVLGIEPGDEAEGE